jgi:uncharacterized SAM-binding protein YcdF (DUF218 family)
MPIVGLVALLLIAYSSRGHWLPVVGEALNVPSEIQSADVIVVLGGGDNSRPRYAGQLFQRGLASHLIATGAPVGSSESTRQLEADGVPGGAIVLASGTISTHDDALRTRSLMEQNGWHTALLVTDPYHIRRSLWTFETAFIDSGLTVWPAPVIGGTFDANHWWRTEDGFVDVDEEYLKLAYYLARGYIQPTAITVR